MRVVAVLCLALLLFGCSNDSGPVWGFPPEPSLTNNDSPQNTMLRLVETYERKKQQEYRDLFTADFTYEFSSSTDPDLVTKYNTGWFKSDETESSSHLFQGYTPAGQPYAPAARSVNIDFETTQPVDDNGIGLDPITHKYLATRVDGQIVIGTSPDPTTYVIENNTDAFYLVRGDQAVGLTSSQPADSVHWYIYRWLDLTTATALPRSLSPQPGHASTWGSLKAGYR